MKEGDQDTLWIEETPQNQVAIGSITTDEERALYVATAAALPDWSDRGRWGVSSVGNCEGDLAALAWRQLQRDLNPQPARPYLELAANQGQIRAL